MRISETMDARICIFFILVSFIVYNANMRLVGTGDSYPARVAPFALITEGTLNLDHFKTQTFQVDPMPYWLQPTRDGHVGSLFPVVTPILVTPLYLPVVAYLKMTGWTEERLKWWVILMEKFSASLVTAAAVGFMYLALRRRSTEQTAILLTFAFAFATGTWSTSSQALWLHAAAELFLTMAIWLVTGPASVTRSFLVGALMALIAWNRPPDLFIAASFGIPALLWTRRLIPWMVLSAGLVTAAVLTYNIGTFGHILGAWSGVGSGSLGGQFLHGLHGLLFSFGRGLFIFDPFLLLLPIGVFRIVRDPHHRILSTCLAVGVSVEVMFYAMTPFWGGGSSYGPRYMVDLMPAMIWLLVPVVESLGTVGRLAFTAVVMFSVWVEYVGAFHYTGDSNITYFASPPAASDPTPLFNPNDTQWMLESQHPRQPPGMLGVIRNAF